MAPRPNVGTASTKPSPSSLASRRSSITLLSRNVDTVVLGNIQFPAWYYSPYPDSIFLSAKSGVPHPAPSPDAQHGHRLRNDSIAVATTVAASPKIRASSATSSKANLNSALCPILHVCPHCFKYTPDVSKYVVHVQYEQQLRIMHPELPPVPESATLVYSCNGYRVWEVDGETEKLYCQNLSLFGKLFLEQKSVFFDTGGFLYYVLTYTAMTANHNLNRLSDWSQEHHQVHAMNNIGWRSKDVVDRMTQRNVSSMSMTSQTEVLGFFSKENPSWDSNNLACILIFPPYQHRQLGKLLMAVSYKLSGWEKKDGVIGGPEKPLSAMGRRSYYRFWSERVARFLLKENLAADEHRALTGKLSQADNQRHHYQKKAVENGDDRPPRKRRRKNIIDGTVAEREANSLPQEFLTVKEVGKRTGMLAEDVVAALTEMGICELATSSDDTLRAHSLVAGLEATRNQEQEDQDVASMVVRKSRIREWMASHHVSLHDPVPEEGFLGEWAISEATEDLDQDVEADNGTDGSTDEEG